VAAPAARAPAVTYWANNAPAVANILRDAQVLGHLGVGRRLLALQRAAAEVLARGWSPEDQPQPALAATIQVAVDSTPGSAWSASGACPQQAAGKLAVSWTRCLATA